MSFGSLAACTTRPGSKAPAASAALICNMVLRVSFFMAVSSPLGLRVQAFSRHGADVSHQGGDFDAGRRKRLHLALGPAALVVADHGAGMPHARVARAALA